MAEPAREAALLQEAFRLLERARELQESAASLISRAKNEEQSLCQQAQVLDSEIQRLRRSVAAAAKSGAVDAATADKVSLEEEICKVKCVMSDGDAWLLYVYVSLALREYFKTEWNWIYHHYCAMAMALISLTWKIEGEPDCGKKQFFLLLLTWQVFFAMAMALIILIILLISTTYPKKCVGQVAIMQGVAMLLQNRYQHQRLYTSIALGKIV
ncbi:hypothetical protein EJ110_NYTH18919 [Nymphaea thermarum]|nr:hypothetical protein EJ110_NYTH18919 [Nymphaea thermarum]